MAIANVIDYVGNTYLINLEISIEDPAALWTAATRVALKVPGMSIDDVYETIGVRDAPVIEDCLMMLMQPERLNYAGCTLEALQCGQIAEANVTGRQTMRLAL